MKCLVALALSVLIVIDFYSCQKELSFEGGQRGRGFLEKDIAGNCLPAIVNGAYRKGFILSDSNTLTVTLHILQAGSVSVSSDSVNGYAFSFSGSLSDTGLVQVTLRAKGKPLSPGTNNFILHFDSSLCSATVNVVDPLAPASYKLSGNGASCISDSVYGVYLQNVATDSTNKIAIQLLVTSIGSYHIHTNTVNGVSFSGSGLLASTGIDTVFLSATGTPQQSATYTYQVIADSSACMLTVTVYTPQVATNHDLFPLTYGSTWNYMEYVFASSDQRSVTDSSTTNGTQYKIMHEVFTPGAITDYSFRKQGGDYYEYGKVDHYTNTVVFSPAVYADINFLKENLSAGDSWYSDLYVGNASFGQLLNIRYHFTCMEADVNAIVNGKAFTHVWKVTMVPQVAAAGIAPGNTQEHWVFWYAKGVGLIVSTFQSIMISNFSVN